MNAIQTLRHRLKFLPLERPKKSLTLPTQGQYKSWKSRSSLIGKNRLHLSKQVQAQIAEYEAYVTAKAEYIAKREALLQELNALVLAQNTPSDLE